MTKRAKQVLCLVLALAMFAAFGMSAMAASIEITSAVEGAVYNAYKIFDITTSGSLTSTTIETTSEWYNAVAEYAADSDNGLILTLNSLGSYTVTFVSGQTSGNFDAADFAEFLKAEVENPTLGPTGNVGGSYTIAGTGTGSSGGGSAVVATISGLDEGYYFVTTTAGSLCFLDTVSVTAEIREKNTTPSIDKEVYDEEATDYVDSTSATIGDSVQYQLTVTVGTGANGVDFVITDTLPAGLTYDETQGLTVVATYGGDDHNWVSPTNYTTDYDSSSGELTITLLASSLSNLTSQTDTVTITYYATLNGSATVDNLYYTRSGNTNTVELKYADNLTVEAESKVYTYRFAVIKTDSNSNVLADAVFQLTDENGDVIKWVVDTSGTQADWDYYRVATQDDIDNYNASGSPVIYETVTTTTAARLVFEGLEEGTYTLTEVSAPAGYTPLSGTITVVIDADEAGGSYVTFTATSSGDTISSDREYVQIINTGGTEIPSTGGIGTTIFYIVGAALMIGAAVVLITRRRMRNEQ